MQIEHSGDPYVVLGVDRAVTADELKRAYRKMSMAWHPDRHTGESEAGQAEAERRFKLVNAAYVAIGELLRAVPARAAQSADLSTPDDRQVISQSDVRVEAIRAVVASVALRVVPNLPRHAFRRVTNVVEQLLLDTIAVGDRAFVGGFDIALREAMFLVGMDKSLRAEALNVLDAAADELQWRGRGADPETWQTLLRPLERARGNATVASVAQQARPSAQQMRPATQQFRWESLLRPEPLPMVGQSALSILALLLLLPPAPLDAGPRVLLLLLDIAALAALTFYGREL